LATGLRFPEGPIALKDGALLVVEMERGTLTRIAANGTTADVAHLGGGPNGAAVGPDGACYVCNNGGLEWHSEERGAMRPLMQSDDYVGGSIQRVDPGSGTVSALYGLGASGALNGPNDIVFDEIGGFYFTDMGKARRFDIDRSAVYYARIDGSLLKEVVFPMMTANGIWLSPDGRKLYVTETLPARLWEFDVVGPGEIRPEPWPSPNGGRLLYGSDRYQMFDSMAVEQDGNICIATLINGGITVVSPSGELIDFITLDDKYTTNLCFGGVDHRTAFVTLSMSGRIIGLDWPRQGLPTHFTA